MSICVFGPEEALLKHHYRYLPEMKTTISLKNMVETEPDRDMYEVEIILHDRPNVTSDQLAHFVAQEAGVPLTELQVIPGKIRLTVHQDKLRNLAALDSVNRIEEVREKTTYNDRARRVLQVGETPVHLDKMDTTSGYQGTGQIVCVADSGIDIGTPPGINAAEFHPAFAGRIEKVFDLIDEDHGRDPSGHGTHVCGSICGNSTYTDPRTGKKLRVKGIAPGAKLMVQSMSKWNEHANMWKLFPPVGLKSLFEKPYSLGVRIHSNSWGDVWSGHQLGYDTDATTIDTFISEHQDFTILIAAGNDMGKHGCEGSQIGDNSAAKNCITVGATGSTRHNDGNKFYPGIPGTLPTDTAEFSSRGPTIATKGAKREDIPGRIKPDVVAPGVVVLSAASRAITETNEAKVVSLYGQTGDKNWLFMSGTSMATPLVSGCVALIREALGRLEKQHPSAALIKVLLVNGATNFTAAKGAVFDYQQGFGRVNVQRSIAMVEGNTASSGFVDGGNKLESTRFDVPILRTRHVGDRTWESAAIAVPRGSNKVAVTLAYPDPHGALLQNDLNLIVRAGEFERHGNMGEGDGFDTTSKSLPYRIVHTDSLHSVSTERTGLTKYLTCPLTVSQTMSKRSSGRMSKVIRSRSSFRPLALPSKIQMNSRLPWLGMCERSE